MSEFEPHIRDYLNQADTETRHHLAKLVSTIVRETVELIEAMPEEHPANSFRRAADHALLPGEEAGEIIHCATAREMAFRSLQNAGVV